MKAEKSYYNESIDFYIEKPESWLFFPTQWVTSLRNKTAGSNKDVSAILQRANIPFVYMQKPIDRANIALPTVQATCRYYENPTPEHRQELADAQIQTFEKNYQDFRLIKSSAYEALSNCPAIYYKVSFSLNSESGVPYHCLSQAWTVFSNSMVYTIGLSGPAKNYHEYESDINEIVSSILIGQAT